MSFRTYASFLQNIRYLVDRLGNGQETERWSELFEAIVREADFLGKYLLTEVKQMILDTLLVCSLEDRETAIRITEFCARITEANRDDMWNFVPWNRELDFDDESVQVPSEAVNYVLTPLRVADVTQCTRISDLGDLTVRMATRMNEWKFLRVLIRFGFWNGSADGKDFKYWTEIFECWYILRNDCHLPLPDICYRGVWNELQERCGRMLSDSVRGFGRIILITRTLIATYSREVQSSKVFIETLADPLVSEDEVREFIHFLLGEEAGERHQNGVDRVVDRFVECFGSRPYAPRSLAHLCRCAARNVLVKNKSRALPNLVEQLPIPRTLQNFLLGAPE